MESLKELINKLTEAHGPQLNIILEWFNKVPFVWILILLMFLDVLTGYIAAAAHKEVDSEISYKGALKKAQMLLIVAAGMVFEMVYGDIPWGRIIAGFLSLGEMASIIENADKAGVPIPHQLKETMKRLRSAEKDAEIKPDVAIGIKIDSNVYEAKQGPKGEKGDKGDKGESAQ